MNEAFEATRRGNKKLFEPIDELTITDNLDGEFFLFSFKKRNE
jgi:hypothetical protein